MTDVTLKVNGKAYAGWKSARVTRGIETLSGGFELSVSDRWNGQSKPWPIREEDECVLSIGREPVITGYVDRRKVSYGPQEHSLEVSGRDKAAVLVDCSAVLKSWEFTNMPLFSLAQKLAEPFDVYVVLDDSVGGGTAVSLGTGKSGGSVGAAGSGGKLAGIGGLPKPPKKFSVDPGESAFEVLDRACRMAGVLPVSDGQGGIVITRSGVTRAVTDLVEGKNILSASAEFDVATRYRRYIVKGQGQASNDWFGSNAAAVRGEAIDENVRREDRELIIRPESGVTGESAKVRAQWEAKVRAARADSVSVTVQGWTQGNGEIWPINSLVRVKSPLLGVDGDLLITQTVMSLDDGGGTTTQITLKRPDAFLPEPKVSSTGTGSAWKEIAHGVKTK